VDQSPDKVRKPGRICIEFVNECLDRSLNDCDPLAICEDQPEGYFIFLFLSKLHSNGGTGYPKGEIWNFLDPKPYPRNINPLDG